jgi:hypothetical protein
MKVEKDLGWLFREQRPDYGIDAQIEVVKDNEPTGKIIAAQIKSGDSFFQERTADGIVFRGDTDHLNYWLKHKLPVIVVLYDPTTEKAHWQSVIEEHIERTRKGWKMLIPEHQIIDPFHAEHLESVSDGTPYFQRLASLHFAHPWMKLLESGEKLIVKVGEWVNKSSGKCSIELIHVDEDGEEHTLQEWSYYVYYPGFGVVYGLRKDFPWADLSHDEEVYEEAAYETYQEECGHWDKEDGRYYYHESYEEWKGDRRDDRLRPYGDSFGEVALWQLELKLNDVGRAFLRMDEYLSGKMLPPIPEGF